MQPIIIKANPELASTYESIIKETRIIRVAPYCRVSSESDLQLNSFEAQVKFYTEYVNQQPNWQLVDIYADEGITGTKMHKRFGLKRLIKDYREGKIDMIICKSVSRMCRNTADTLKIVRETRELGVDIYFENENIHTLGQGGEFLITIFASLAQDTSRQISDNVLWGMDKSMKKGTIYGNGQIYGYDRIDKKLYINEEQAKVVREIFQLYLDGYGTRTIANKLQDKGYKTSTGLTFWSPTTITGMLKNEKYAGRLLLRKSFTTDYLSHRRLKNKGEKEQYLFLEDENGNPIIPPIISEETFEAVQNEIKRRSSLQKVENGRATKHSNRYPLSTKVKCGNCGASFYREVWNRNKTYARVVWSCGNYMSRGKDICGVKPIPEKVIYRAIDLIMKDIRTNNEKAIDTFMKAVEEVIEDTSLDRDVENIEIQIRQQKEELKSLRIMRRRNEITEEEFIEDAEDLRITITQLENALIEVQEQQDISKQKAKKFELLQKAIKNEFENIGCTDEIVNGLVEKVVVRSREDFDIYLSGDIKANCSGDLDNILKCNVQYVLYRTFRYDMSDMISFYSNMKNEPYHCVRVNVYFKI